MDVSLIPDSNDTDTLILGRNSDYRNVIGFRRTTNLAFVKAADVTFTVPCPIVVGERATFRFFVSSGRLYCHKNGVETGSVAFTAAFDNTFTSIGAASSSRYAHKFFSARIIGTGEDRNYSAAGITSGTVLPDLNNPANNGTLTSFTGNPWAVEPNLPAVTPFTFNTVTGVELSTFVESNQVTIAGASGSVPLTVANGLQYRINTGSGWSAYSTAPTTISNGHQLQVALTSSATALATDNTLARTVGALTLGTETVPFTFTIVTRPPTSGVYVVSKNIYENFANTLDFIVSGTNQNVSITAATDDVIFIAVAMNKAAGVNYTPTATWMGQTFTQLPLQEHKGSAFAYFWLKVTNGGTGRLTGSLGVWTRFNATIHVLRSATNSFASPPLKTSARLSYDTGTFALPSLTVNSIAPTDLVFSILHMHGQTPSWDSWPTTLATPTGSFAQDLSIQNGVVNVGRLYSTTTTGRTGNVTTGWTFAPANQNMYNATLIAFAESNNNIDSPTNPVVPGGPLSATLIGYTTLTSISGNGFTGNQITVNGTTASTVMSGLVEGQIMPYRLPATNIPITYTDGVSTSTIQQDMSLPLGYDTIRDVDGTPANLRDIITNHPDFIGTWYFDNGTPLVAGDTFYWPTQTTVNSVLVDNGFKISEIGEIEANKAILPITVPCYLRRANGLIQLHNLTVNASGVVNVSLLDWTVQTSSPFFDGNYPKTLRP
jgi:hypothetical protein